MKTTPVLAPWRQPVDNPAGLRRVPVEFDPGGLRLNRWRPRRSGPAAASRSRHAPVSLLAPYSYGEIIMATALGYVWVGDFSGPWTWVGIAVSGIYISVRKRGIKTR